MVSANSQVRNTPLQLSFGNNENKFDLDQLRSVEILITGEQPSVPFTTTNMTPSQIPLILHHSAHETLSRRQTGRRRRRQRKHQRKRQPQREEQRRQRSSEQQSQHQQQSEQDIQRTRSTRWVDEFWDHDNWQRLGYPEYMEENTTTLLEAYEWEKMDPKLRCEQEQLNELQGLVVLEKLAMIQDELEQLHQIELNAKLHEEEEQQRDNNELIQVQQWEQIAFLVQQLNQN